MYLSNPLMTLLYIIIAHISVIRLFCPNAPIAHNTKIIGSNDNRDDAFGHMTVNFNGERCNCGNYGCIEKYSSIPATENAFIKK